MIMETIEKKIKRRSTYVQDLARTQRASTFAVGQCWPLLNTSISYRAYIDEHYITLLLRHYYPRANLWLMPITAGGRNLGTILHCSWKCRKTAVVYTKRKKTYSWYAKTKFSKQGTLLNLKFVLGTILNFLGEQGDKFWDVEFLGDHIEENP